MQRSLAASSIACAQYLDQLSSLLKNAERAQLSALQQSAAEDQSTRFQIWAGNLGAFQRLPATASLDYRLRESPRIATQIYELLEDLKTSVENVRGIVLGERPNRRSEPDVEPDDDSVDREDESDCGSTAGNDESGDEAADLSEAEEIFESIKDTITSLFRLAVMIRKATPRDRYARALGGHNPFMEDFDIAHVGHKFEKLDIDSNKWLKERLGKAITQRRQYLRYAREHRYKLGKKPAELWKPAADVPKSNLQLPIDLSASQAGRTNTSRPATTLADTTASTLFLQEATHTDKDFQDDQSQTSYALSALDEDDVSRLTLPRLSEVAKGQPSFECPFCWTLQTFRREKAWKKHALSDLRPYVCTFEDCDLKMFPDRKIWFEHEMKQHRAKWLCHFCGQNSFKSAQGICEHLRSSHGTNGNQDQLDALAEASKQPLTQFSASDCPFCIKWEADLRKSNPEIPHGERVFVTAMDLRRHMGSHMQDLALFAIPRGYLEEGEGDAASKASARAAGMGNDSASIAMSNAEHSTDSYDSARDLVIHHQPVNMDQCVGTIEAAMRQTDTAFEEILVNILPALNDVELKELHARIPLSSKIASSPKQMFASIAKLVCRGQMEAERTWLQTWHTYPQTSRMWWNVACSFLTSDPRFLNRLRAISPDIQACIANAFKAGEYPPLFCDILKRAALRGRSERESHVVENGIMVDITSLRSRSAEATHVAIALFARTNRYLRKLVRLERKRFPDSSIFPSYGNPLKESPAFDFDEDDTLFLQYLLGHLFTGAVDPVSRDVNYLHAALQAYGPQSFDPDADSIEPSVSEDWQSLLYQILNLHWNKNHLRAVKSIFEDEYSATLESFIERLYDPSGRDNMFIPLLKALVSIETGEDMIDFSGGVKSGFQSVDDASAKILTPTDALPPVRADLLEPPETPKSPLEPTLQPGKLSIAQITLLKVVISRMEAAYVKEKTLQDLLQTISDSQRVSTTQAWMDRLSRYPIFQENLIFLADIKPFLTLRVYEPGETILAKSEAAFWVGWLIIGRATYIASYNPNDPTRLGRGQWTTSENAITFGLVGALLELPSLSHNVAETACVVAQIRKEDFKSLVREHKEVEKHLETQEFGTSFAVARECLRIEVAFGKPWWYIFDPWEAAATDIATATSKILQNADNPKIITSLVRSIGNMQYTPLDLVLQDKNIEAAKLLLESGAKVRTTTIKVALDNDDADLVELLLTRPGAAEAANEVLRSEDDAYVPKLQKMLKAMQGRVSLVTASALEEDTKTAIALSPSVVVEVDQEEVESSREEDNEHMHESTDRDDNGGHTSSVLAYQDIDEDQPREHSPASGTLAISEFSHSDMPAKKSLWVSPMGSIRQRWGPGIATATDDQDDIEEISSNHSASTPLILQPAPGSSVPDLYVELRAALNYFEHPMSNPEHQLGRVKALLYKFADKSLAASCLNIHYSNSFDCEAPIVSAIKGNHAALVALLLEYGADPNTQTVDGQFLLDLTLPRAYNRSEITKLLFYHRATEVNDALQGHFENALELHRIHQIYGQDWFDIVREAHGSEKQRANLRQILEIWPQDGKTASLRSQESATALDIAIANNDVDTVLLLLEYGADSGDPDGLPDVLARPSIDEAIVQALQLHGKIKGQGRILRESEDLSSGEDDDDSEASAVKERFEGSKEVDQKGDEKEVNLEGNDDNEMGDEAKLTSFTTKEGQKESPEVQKGGNDTPSTSTH